MQNLVDKLEGVWYFKKKMNNKSNDLMWRADKKRKGTFLMEDADDTSLVELSQAQDKEAFNELIRRYQKKVFNIAYRLLGDFDESADLTQEVFIKAYLSIHRFHKKSAFYTWLYSITTNLCRNKLKSQKRYKRISLDAQNDLPKANNYHTPDAELERKQLQQIVQEAIESLPPNYRILIVLRDIQGLSYKEISQILKYSQNKVKSRLHSARMILKDKLNEVIEDVL
jgi:RNA polymerase sigma-70 factor (ECF subfamily)